MKKLILILSAVVGSILPFGKAEADNCHYKYSDSSWESDSSENIPSDTSKYYKYETCSDSNGNETSKSKYKCSGESCNLVWIKDSTKAWSDNTRYKYYDCDGDECTLVGTSISETGNSCDYDMSDNDCKDNKLHLCSNGTCYAKRYNGYFYDNSGNIVGGYSDTCGTGYCSFGDDDYSYCNNFSCSGGSCHCNNDPNKVVSVPLENQTIAPAFAYYANDEKDFNLCPDNSSSCYLNDNNQLVTTCKSSYLEKGGSCVSEAVGCGTGYRQIENFCNRIRYTPAEAAAVLKDGNTNVVTITFKK